MCGRFSVTDPRQLALRFNLDPVAVEGLEPRYNVAPTQQVPALIAPGRLELVRWGLIPRWAKDESIGAKAINARCETLEQTALFRDAFRRQRCLVLADGFYEWRREGKRKWPLYIRLRSREPFSFAGLWAEWNGRLSCSIVTTTPNSLIAPIHGRMPVILTAEAEHTWLDTCVQGAEALRPLLVPFPEELLELFPVSTVVNSPANDTPDCIAPLSH